MFYPIFMLLLFSILLIAFNHRNRYVYLFLVMSIGVMTSFFAIILHINTFGNYYYYNNISLFKLDYRIYSLITSRIRLSLKWSIRIMNIGLALYLLAMPLFVLDLCRSYSLQKMHMPMLIISAAQCVFPIALIAVIDPYTSTCIYIQYHMARNPEAYRRLLMAAEGVIKGLILVDILFPILLLLYRNHSMSVRYLRKKTYMFALCMFLFNLFYYIFFYMSPFCLSVEKACLHGFWIFERYQVEQYQVFYYFPLVVLALILTCSYILFSFQLDISIIPFKGRKIHRNIQMLNGVLEDVMHSQKNLYFVEQVTLRRMLQDSPELGENTNYQKLDDLVSHALENTTDMLDNLSQIKYAYYENDLCDILREAVDEIDHPSNVQLEWIREGAEGISLLGMYDRYHLKKAFVNILHNAIEAIQSSEKQNGRLQIQEMRFMRWAVIAITDNGTGISVWERNRIFLPHYSGKKGRLNWGLGLPNVYRVVKAHMGQVKIDSRVNQYTTVLVMLPLGKEGKYDNARYSR